MTNLSAVDIIGRRVRDVMPDTEPVWIARYGHVAMTGEPARFDHFSKVIGRHFEVVAFQPRKGQFACIFTDITAHLKAQTDRDRMFRLSVDLICVARLDGYFAEVNPSWSRVTGWSEAELLSHQWLDFVHPDDIDATIVAGKTLQQDKPIIGFENRYRCADESYRWFSWNTYPLAGEGIAFAIARDITAAKAMADEKAGLEQQLRQSQKMEAVGRLAGGVAHDFNNLLQAIMGYTSLVLEELAPGSKTCENLEEVNRAAEKATGLVRQLLSFSRRDTQKLEPLDMNDVVQGIMKLVRRILGEDVELLVSPGPNLGMLYADRGQLEQVLMNLCVNARDAMPDGGRILIETSNEHLDDAYCAVHADAHTGPYVSTSVSDTGSGMTREVIDHIFEPFFTTKDVGKGTGLGLATVYGIVRQHGGFISIYSEEGQGSCFRIYLPVTASESVKEESTRLWEPPPTGTETVLVAEDEPQIRILVEQVLTRAGYRVILARDGAEAIELFAAATEPIHIAVLDMVMPRMGGRMASQRIRELKPNLPILFASGYSPETFGGPAITNSITAMLQKPMVFSDMLRTIRKLLDARSQ
jgi:PAS domain S-box-containing protein